MEIASTRSSAPYLGTVLWTVAGLVLYVLIGTASLFVSLGIAGFVLGTNGIDTAAGTHGLSIRNAAHPIVWGLAVAAASVPVGRRLVDGLRFSTAAWCVLVLGLVLATVTTYLVAEFVRTRYGVFDPEYAGFSFFAGPAVVAIALAAWATLATPRGNGIVLAGATVAAAAGLALALLPSVGGAADGVDASSIPIVAAFTADGIFGAAATLLALARSRVPST